jgi:hypothetical protein
MTNYCALLIVLLLKLIVYCYVLFVFITVFILVIPVILFMSNNHLKTFHQKVFFESIEIINKYTFDWLDSFL